MKPRTLAAVNHTSDCCYWELHHLFGFCIQLCGVSPRVSWFHGTYTQAHTCTKKEPRLLRIHVQYSHGNCEEYPREGSNIYIPCYISANNATCIYMLPTMFIGIFMHSHNYGFQGCFGIHTYLQTYSQPDTCRHESQIIRMPLVCVGWWFTCLA